MSLQCMCTADSCDHDSIGHMYCIDLLHLSLNIAYLKLLTYLLAHSKYNNIIYHIYLVLTHLPTLQLPLSPIYQVSVHFLLRHHLKVLCTDAIQVTTRILHPDSQLRYVQTST